MQIVIDLSDYDYELINQYTEGITNYPTTLRLYRAVRDGIPLPKGHGRLIDEKDIDFFEESMGTSDVIRDLMMQHNLDYANEQDEDEIESFAKDLLQCAMNVVKTADTVIEADKEE